MPAGTIALTNNSAAVTGTGTSFTTELKVGDFVGVIVGGAPYTLVVASISSSTQITLGIPFNGPTTSGLAWYAVPATLQVAITQQSLNDISKILRGMILDKANWQQVFTGTGNITVNLPDGTSWSGLAWNGISTAISGKADKVALDNYLLKSDNLNGVADKSAARTNLGVGYGSAAGTVAQGNDSRLGTLNGKSGGVVSSGTNFQGAIQATKTVTSEVSQSSEMLYTTLFTGNTERARAGIFVGVSAAGERVGQLQVGQDGIQKTWTFVYGTGSATAPGQWINGSDQRFKTNIKEIQDPLDKMRVIKGCTWDRLDFDAKGIGFIAQDVLKVFPDSVYDNFAPVTLKDGTVLENTYSLDTSGVAAALHHQAILALMDKIEALEKRDSDKDAVIAELQKRMKAIGGLDA